ncbi:MAG: carbohydrate kinase family protein [Firmicutes bacterium]|nr:carbohydrate kinase family protein [Bacillota bacterium]
MIICVGTVLIDCIVTESGTESVADSITLAPGGEAFNEAVSLARLGEKVLLIVPAGQDAAGDMIRAMLDREGIILQADYRGATPVSLLTVDAAGGRKSRVSKVHALTGYRPQLPCLDPQLSGSDPQLPSIKSVTFVTMASLFRPPFLDPADCLAFARSVKKIPGVRLLADTKLPKGTDPQLADYRETLALLDWITPNEAEALHYTHASSAVEAAEIFRSYGVRNVVIKLAERGCYVLPEQGEAFTVPAFPVECVDGIGAGDAFNAGLIHSLPSGMDLKSDRLLGTNLPSGRLSGTDLHPGQLSGTDLRKSVLFASACAAVSVTQRGATAALQSTAQVEELINRFCEINGPVFF